MRVAVIDVGSTARLLVANVTVGGAVLPVDEERAYLRLGAEIERKGKIGRKKLEEASSTCRAFAAVADEHDAERVAVFVTAPGRQGSAGADLADTLADATSAPVRVLTAEEEGRLAYDGALARAGGGLPGVVAVVDVGGGSTEIAVGTPSLGAAWVRSADLGSLRLTRACLEHDPPTRAEIAAARDAAAGALDDLKPPSPDLALAVGGSARALAKIAGRRFDADELDRTAKLLSRRPAAKAARSFGIGPERAETLLAGALLLAGASRALGAELVLGQGGVREGAALALAGAEVAARAA